MPRQIIVGAVGIGTDLNPPLIRVIDPPAKKQSSFNPFITPPPPPCPDSGTVEIVLSGISSCGCVGNGIATVSIDGTYTLLSVGGGNFFLDGVGSWSTQGYDVTDPTPCTTPVGDPAMGVFKISASCSVGPVWSIIVDDSAGSGFTVFSASVVTAGTPAGNDIQCSSGSASAGDGTATLTV